MKLEKKKRLLKKYGVQINLLDEFYEKIHIRRTLFRRRLIIDGKNQKFVGGYMAKAPYKVFVYIRGNNITVKNMTVEDWDVCFRDANAGISYGVNRKKMINEFKNLNMK